MNRSTDETRTRAVFSRRAQWPEIINKGLDEVDPEMAEIIEREKARQWKGLELIPSENFVSKSVMDAVGSVMTNKYSEGYPGARYYGGNEFIDMAEKMCQERASKAFNWIRRSGALCSIVVRFSGQLPSVHGALATARQDYGARLAARRSLVARLPNRHEED